MLDSTNIKNKKIERADVEVKTSEVVKQHFFFPDYNVTILATSREEAEKELAILIANK